MWTIHIWIGFHLNAGNLSKINTVSSCRLRLWSLWSNSSQSLRIHKLTKNSAKKAKVNDLMWLNCFMSKATQGQLKRFEIPVTTIVWLTVRQRTQTKPLTNWWLKTRHHLLVVLRIFHRFMYDWCSEEGRTMIIAIRKTKEVCV